MKNQLYTCPCCGYRTLSGFPGSYDICHVCFWEDDMLQILDPWFSGGANKSSLVEAQINFIRIGACDEHGKKFVQGVLPQDERDPQWRLVIETDRTYVTTPREIEDSGLWGELDAWYYWHRNSGETLANRKKSLQQLIEFQRKPSEMRATIAAFDWDIEEELVQLEKRHRVTVLQRFINGEVSSDDVEDWANLIECRDDIGYDEVAEVLHTLANPAITEELSKELAVRFINKLTVHNTPLEASR